MKTRDAIEYLVLHGRVVSAEILRVRNDHAAVLDQSVVRLMATYRDCTTLTPAQALRQLFPEDFK